MSCVLLWHLKGILELDIENSSIGNDIVSLFIRVSPNKLKKRSDRGNKGIVEAAYIDFEAQASEGEGADDDGEDDDNVTPGGSQHRFIDNATQPALMTQVTPG